MFKRIVTFTAAVALMLSMAAAVHGNEFKGKVVRLDPAHKVVILDDGKMYRLVPNSVVVVDEKPVTFETIRPGASVVIRSGEVVEFKDGKYVVISPSASPR